MCAIFVLIKNVLTQRAAQPTMQKMICWIYSWPWL